jgi:hypothetical protein
VKKIILLLLAASAAHAGAVRTMSAPVRHPVRTVEIVARVATFPLLHPVQAARGLKLLLF